MAFFQVLPKETGIAERFGEGFGQAFGGTLQDQIGKFFKEKKESREIENIQKKLAELSPDVDETTRLSTILASKASPEAKNILLELMKMQGAAKFAKQFASGKPPSLQQIIEGVSRGYIPPGIGQELTRSVVKDPLETAFFEEFFGKGDSLLGGEEISPTGTVTDFVEEDEILPAPPLTSPKNDEIPTIKTLDRPIPKKIPRNTKTGKGWEKYSDEDLTKWKAVGGKIGSAASAELSRRDKEKERKYRLQKDEQSKKEFGHKATSQYAEEIRKAAENAREVRQAVNEVIRLSNEGLTGLNLKNAFQKFLQSRKSFLTPAFVNKDAQSLLSASKSLAGGFKELFGSRPTQAEFFWYENILPDLLKDADTNIAAAQYFGKIADHRLRMQEIADEIVEENEGYRPLDLDRQVRKRLKAETDSLIKEGEKLYQQSQTTSPQRVDDQLNKAIAKGREVIEKYGDEEEIKTPSGNRKNVYDKKTGRLLGDIDEEEVEKVDTNLYIVR